MVTYDNRPLGICPACGETVKRNEDVVWTCPCDLDPKNAYWESSPITEDQCEADGWYSLCANEHPGWTCFLEELPLHSTCHEAGNY
jgi:hypothetical protein